MQIDVMRANLSVGALSTLDKAKVKQQDQDFAARLREITEAENKDKNSTEDAKLRKVCQDMEAVFLNIMLTQMRASVPKTGLTGGNSSATEMYQSMLDTEMTKEMAAAGGTGLADVMYRQLSQNRGKLPPALY